MGTNFELHFAICHRTENLPHPHSAIIANIGRIKCFLFTSWEHLAIIVKFLTPDSGQSSLKYKRISQKVQRENISLWRKLFEVRQVLCTSNSPADVSSKINEILLSIIALMIIFWHFAPGEQTFYVGESSELMNVYQPTVTFSAFGK